MNIEDLAADDIEAAMLGACFLQPGLIVTIARAGGREAFWREGHRHIYDAMLEAYKSSSGFDHLTVCNMLADADRLGAVGGHQYILRLTLAPSAVHADNYLAILAERRRLRHWYSLGQNIGGEINQGRTSQELATMVGSQIRDIGTGSNAVPMHESALQAWDRLTQIMEGTRTPVYSTNVPWLDHVLGGGLAPGHSYYLGALYKIGKSKMAAYIAHAMLTQGWTVDWWSVEMAAHEMTDRFTSLHAKVPESRLVTGKLSDAQLRATHKALAEDLPKWRHHHHHNAKPDVYEIAADTAARRATMDDDRQLLVVDYLQYCKTGKDLRSHEEIAEASQILNAISKDLQIPVIIVYQLAPGKVEARAEGDFTPMPRHSDARGSSQVMMDANHLITMHRPWYTRKDRISRFTVLERSLARGGVNTTAHLYADLNLNTFTPWSDATPAPFEAAEDTDQPWLL